LIRIAVGFISYKSGPPTILVTPACIRSWSGNTLNKRGVRGGFVLQWPAVGLSADFMVAD
jgi:hypothetical protein